MPKESKKAAKASTTARLKKVPKEKRLKQYRSSCPNALQERLERASTQKLYLIQQSQVPDVASEGHVDFTVLGSTGNVYTVQFGHVPTCNCPDFTRRADMCKHIMFILLKVMGLSPTNPLSYQKAYLSEELQELYTILRTRRVGGSVRANALVCAAAASGQSAPAQGVTRRELTPDDSDCPICFDTLDDGSVTFCRGACGANFHAACIQRWLSQSRSGCPNCRQPWLKDGEKKDGGYTNLGALQGQSAVRDTSTYHKYRYNKRF